MFRNPVYDMFVVVPALLIAGLLGLLVMTSPAHAAEISATTTAPTGSRALTASTSGNTLPDPSQKTIVVTRDSLLLGTSTAPSSAIAIHSTNELLAYAKDVLAEDPYLGSISLSGSEIVVNYRTQGKLLGLLPLAVPTTARVRTDGSVSFTEPWYGAVTIEERDRMKTALEVRVHALLTSEDYLSSMSLAPATQAEILDIIEELLG